MNCFCKKLGIIVYPPKNRVGLLGRRIDRVKKAKKLCNLGSRPNNGGEIWKCNYLCDKRNASNYGISKDNHEVIIFERLAFLMFSIHTKTQSQRFFFNSSSLKSVFENHRFRPRPDKCEH